ncbi:uncharacterized protein [Rutidosis leptorrhynchoides]|uniref:uncharacterized protein isoform X1 n=1 Tax=Rutidosis leptorrhynchoides TaxID=125765 RepID=UPI003A994630
MDHTSTQYPNNSATGIIPAPEDIYLSNSTQLSRQQLLRRRSHNVKQLSKCYRDHYWGLMEEIRVQYREYLWKFGVSPFEKENNVHENNNVKLEEGIVEGNVIGDGTGFGNMKCLFNNCNRKAMTLTKFCRDHILSDSKQQLYKPCEFNLKSAQGRVPCGKPVLRSTVPCYCSVHFLKAQQHVYRALKKAGLNVSSTHKLAPKMHVIVTEYVREIQEKRKNRLRADKKKIEPKLEID